MSQRERSQRMLKGQLILESHAMSGIDAMLPGDGDFAFGVDWLTSQAERLQLPYVASNLVRADGGEALFPSRKLVQRSGRTIGIIGLAGGDLSGTGLRAEDATAAARRELAALQAEGVDVVVVLSHLGLEADRALAQEVEGIDFIFGGDSRPHLSGPLSLGGANIFQLTGRGKHIGEVNIGFVEGGTTYLDANGARRNERRRQSLEQRLVEMEARLAGAEDDRSRQRYGRSVEFTRNQLAELGPGGAAAPDGPHHSLACQAVPMGDSIPDQAATKQVLDRALALMGDELPTVADEKAGSVSRPTPADSPFVGAGRCQTCHPNHYQDWRSSAHAQAYTTLVREQRHMDLDCWSCHVTGANQPGGPAGPTEVGQLRGVQCEACHGPGRDHVATPTRDTIVASPGQALCMTCHTPEQDEGRFNYETYLPQVNHSRMQAAGTPGSVGGQHGHNH